MASEPSGHDVERTEFGRALGEASLKRRAPNLWARSGQKCRGSQPSANSAVISTFFGPSEARKIGILVPDRVGDQLQRLAKAGALTLGQRDLVLGALVIEAVPPPDRTADLDDSAVRANGAS